MPDPNVLAFNIVRAVTAESQPAKPSEPLLVNTVPLTGEDKNPAAVTLGRLGGLKGGPARAKKLSKKARSEIARQAALARWSNKGGKKEE